MARQERLMDTFLVLADTLVDNYDIIDFLQLLAERSVELLDTSAAGIMLADADGELHHAACSSEQMRLVELFELQIEQGPCFDAYNQRAPVRCDGPKTQRRAGQASVPEPSRPASWPCRRCRFGFETTWSEP